MLSSLEGGTGSSVTGGAFSTVISGVASSMTDSGSGCSSEASEGAWHRLGGSPSLSHDSSPTSSPEAPALPEAAAAWSPSASPPSPSQSSPAPLVPAGPTDGAVGSPSASFPCWLQCRSSRSSAASHTTSSSSVAQCKATFRTRGSPTEATDSRASNAARRTLASRLVAARFNKTITALSCPLGATSASIDSAVFRPSAPKGGTWSMQRTRRSVASLAKSPPCVAARAPATRRSATARLASPAAAATRRPTRAAMQSAVAMAPRSAMQVMAVAADARTSTRGSSSRSNRPCTTGRTTSGGACLETCASASTAAFRRRELALERRATRP
mmetsp:Transcript_90087/g.291077  ORF Transcript_90087/g.291077 Transcript_90087/m.291077 type:complete len:328 (+) Transcript_90087:503-1486(+)